VVPEIRHNRRRCSVCQQSTGLFSDEDKILIKSLYLKGYTAKGFTDKFPEKIWTKRGVAMLLKSCGRQSLKCYHTTGSFQSHPHFIEENNHPIVCLNISNILLTHKYTQHTHFTHVEKLKSVHLKCNLFAFSSISAEYLQKIWIFNFPR